MAGIIIDTLIIDELLKNYFPVLNDFFKENSPYIHNFIHKWLVTIFCNDFNEDMVYLIWDFIFLQGNIVLFKACLVVFKILKKSILLCKNNFEKTYSLFTTNITEIQSRDKNLLYGLAFKNFELSEDYIEKKRQSFSLSVICNIEKDNKTTTLSKQKEKEGMDKKVNNSGIKCNINWPVCINYTQRERPRKVINNIILRYQKKTKYIENYFFNKVNDDIKPNESNNSISPSTKSNQILIKNRKKNNSSKSILIKKYITKNGCGPIELKEDLKMEKLEENKEEDLYNILIERENHICISPMEKCNKDKKSTDISSYNSEESSISSETIFDLGTFSKKIEMAIYKKILSEEKIKQEKEKIHEEFKTKPYNENFDDSFGKKIKK